MNLHEQEERDFGRGPLLWDADPDVCCAYRQLGACSHTEDFDYDVDEDDFLLNAEAMRIETDQYFTEDEEPF